MTTFFKYINTKKGTCNSSGKRFFKQKMYMYFKPLIKIKGKTVNLEGEIRDRNRERERILFDIANGKIGKE